MCFRNMSKKLCILFFFLVLATPVKSATLEGDFIKFNFNEDTGTIGNAGSGTPGLVYDRTGQGDFSQFGEVLEWGSAYESFGFSWDTSGGYILNNNHNNTGSFSKTNVLYDIGSYVQAVTWEGTYSGLIDIQHKYVMPNDSRYIKVTTTITVNNDFNQTKFVRLINPDQDRTVSPTGTVTENNRGLGTISPNDIVYAVGDESGIIVGLYTQSSLNHNAGFLTNWAGDINDLSDESKAQLVDDALIGLIYETGDLKAGDTIELNYAYLLTADGLPLEIPNLVSLGKFVPYAETNNELNIATEMERIYGNTTPGVQAILDEVDTLPTQDDKHIAIASMANSYGGMANAGIRMTNMLFNQIGMRSDGLLDRKIVDEEFLDEYGSSSTGAYAFSSSADEFMQSQANDDNKISRALMFAEKGINVLAQKAGFGVRSDDGLNVYCNESKYRIWTSSAFSNADLESTSNNVGGDVGSYSLALGLDYDLDENSVVGFGYAYSSYDADFNAFNASQGSDYHSLLAFYNYSNDKREYINLFGSVIKGDNDMQRTVVIGLIVIQAVEVQIP